MKAFSLFFLLLLIGCYNHFDELPAPEGEQWPPTVSIGSLVEGRVAAPVVVEGIVTTSDSTGNFYKELLLENQGVLRISVGMYDLCALYGRGTTAAVRIDQGQVLQWSKEGILTLVVPANFNALSRKLHKQPYFLKWSVPTVTLAQIGAMASGTTVRIKGLRFASAGSGATFSGETIVEQGASTASLYTSPYALFANQKLPKGTFDMVAVVVGKQLKISDPATDILIH